MTLTGCFGLVDAVRFARSKNATDLHVEAGAPAAVRIDGVLQAIGDGPLSAGDVQALANELFASRPLRPEEGDVSVAWCDDELGTLRGHAFRSLAGIALAIRLFPRALPSLESLDLPPSVTELAEHTRGLVLIAGPTGSGKSTTMAALVDRINARAAKRIVTLEDPIEYRHRNCRSFVTQREIGRDTPSLEAALRGVLRSDPDVIVVGELRDGGAVRAALTAAETGHLVLATVHTGDAPQTVDRIVDSFEGAAAAQVRAQLAGVLLGVTCQRLVRRADGKGRRAVVEVMIATEGVRNLIRDGKTHQLANAIATGRQHGMQTMAQHASELHRLRRIDAPDTAL
ncbi:MAG TPA: PilT/PilU family type 4a pilus ATPase [Candidatus Baltobacteraceae bacterium]|jgi:twitching motility protein PilT|nr:PilT/PilU family type 4a pilus ATPase [Candidatus Baltobacteraceae bacterium]